MPDNDDLSTFTDGFSEGMHVNPIPASEVRRRGDRMRRRNTALATVGGVVAAAVIIGTPVALMNGNTDKTGPEPLPSAPTQTDKPDTGDTRWITEIPDDFSVSEGMTTENGTLVDGDQDAFPLCEMAYPTAQGTADTRTVFFSSDGESSTTRTFQLWPDDISADASIDELVAGIQACPQQPAANAEDIVETKLVDYVAAGERSVTWAQQYVADDGFISQLTTVQVTRVGNAVLVNSNYGSAAGDEAIAIAAGVLETQSQQVVASMCVFAAEPCGSAPPAPTESSESSAPPADVAPIPADFQLAQGMDPGGDGDLTGPGADVEGAPVVDVCGTDVVSPSQVVERLAVLETGPEYRETRELYTFPTADEAIETVNIVREAVVNCPRTDGEFYGYTNKVLDGAEGYDSFAWGSFADEGLDGGVFEITRVGKSVLVLYAAGETSESSLQPVADTLTETTLAIAPEMCLWTEDGC